MSLDITSYLLSQGVSDLSTLTAAAGKTSENTTGNVSGTDGTSSDFSQLLDTEVSKITEENTAQTDLSEMQDLIAALDKSILGTVASSLDTEEVANDLLTEKGGSDVIKELINGQMQAVVMTDSDDEEDTEDDLTSSVSGSAEDTSTESLAQNLETIMESMNQIPSE